MSDMLKAAKAMAEGIEKAQRLDYIDDLIERLRQTTTRDRKLDEAVARALGYRLAATTRGPHIMREGSAASWDLPMYTVTPESRANAIKRLTDEAKPDA